MRLEAQRLRPRRNVFPVHCQAKAQRTGDTLSHGVRSCGAVLRQLCDQAMVTHRTKMFNQLGSAAREKSCIGM
jgi:hypothetical protein